MEVLYHPRLGGVRGTTVTYHSWARSGERVVSAGKRSTVVDRAGELDACWAMKAAGLSCSFDVALQVFHVELWLWGSFGDHE